MNIGIVGVGVVGGAVAYGLRKIGHRISCHDKKMDTKLKAVLGAEVVYICVPTPSLANGGCDVSIVEQVVKELHERQYGGIIAIKSTVIVGTTERLIEKYKNKRICFVPEFLRERCAVTDFTENQDLLIIGTNNREVFKTVRDGHGDLPSEVVQLSPSEAEFGKYFNNVYNAALIILSNTFYSLCQECDLNYQRIKDVMVKRVHIYDRYLDCNPELRGFGGACLPKDLKALNVLQQQKSGDKHKLFQCLLDENNKFGVTAI